MLNVAKLIMRYSGRQNLEFECLGILMIKQQNTNFWIVSWVKNFSAPPHIKTVKEMLCQYG